MAFIIPCWELSFHISTASISLCLWGSINKTNCPLLSVLGSRRHIMQAWDPQWSGSDTQRLSLPVGCYIYAHTCVCRCVGHTCMSTKEMREWCLCEHWKWPASTSSTLSVSQLILVIKATYNLQWDAAMIKERWGWSVFEQINTVTLTDRQAKPFCCLLFPASYLLLAGGIGQGPLIKTAWNGLVAYVRNVPVAMIACAKDTCVRTLSQNLALHLLYTWIRRLFNLISCRPPQIFFVLSISFFVYSNHTPLRLAIIKGHTEDPSPGSQGLVLLIHNDLNLDLYKVHGLLETSHTFSQTLTKLHHVYMFCH